MRNFTGHNGPAPVKPSGNGGFSGPGPVMPNTGHNHNGGPTIIGIPPGTGLEIRIDGKGNSHMCPLKP